MENKAIEGRLTMIMRLLLQALILFSIISCRTTNKSDLLEDALGENAGGYVEGDKFEIILDGLCLRPKGQETYSNLNPYNWFRSESKYFTYHSKQDVTLKIAVSDINDRNNRVEIKNLSATVSHPCGKGLDPKRGNYRRILLDRYHFDRKESFVWITVAGENEYLASDKVAVRYQRNPQRISHKQRLSEMARVLSNDDIVAVRARLRFLPRDNIGGVKQPVLRIGDKDLMYDSYRIRYPESVTTRPYCFKNGVRTDPNICAGTPSLHKGSMCALNRVLDNRPMNASGFFVFAERLTSYNLLFTKDEMGKTFLESEGYEDYSHELNKKIRIYEGTATLTNANGDARMELVCQGDQPFTKSRLVKIFGRQAEIIWP